MIKYVIRLVYIIRKINQTRIIDDILSLPISFFKKSIIKFIAILLLPFSFPRKKSLQTSGDRLNNLFSELGPIYIKFGQLLSTRPDLVGYEAASSLKNLQDRVQPFNYSAVESIIKQELKSEAISQIIKINKEPVASASIAQVHKAKLKNGDLVAIKILRPNIEKIYSEDVYLLKFIASIFDNAFKRLNLVKMVEVLEEAMKIELNLKFEAAACSELKEKIGKNNDIIIPNVYWSLTSEKIFTSEWIEGFSIYDTEKIHKYKIDMNKIAKNLALTFFNQAFCYGYFHADLHPGNIILSATGKIALIDFGIMCRLSEKDRIAVAEILNGFFKKDYQQVAKIHLRVGYVPENTNLDLFAISCRAIGDPIIGLPVNEISIGKLLSDLFQMAELFQMQLQPQLLLLQKNLVMVEGIGKQIDPKINMWHIIEPWVQSWAIDNITFEAKMIKYIKNIINKAII